MGRRRVQVNTSKLARAVHTPVRSDNSHHEGAPNRDPDVSRVRSFMRHHPMAAISVIVLFSIIYSQFYRLYIFNTFLPSITVMLLATLLVIGFPALTPTAPDLQRDNQPLIEADDALRKFEAEFASNDPIGLGQVIRLSRLELDKFYQLTLGQARGSYRYAVLASWLGFGVIILGLLQGMGVLPAPSREMAEGVANSNATTSVTVTMAVGAVMELVSGLFLWVYRSADRRFGYFYDRQMHFYSVFICTKLAMEMTTKDESMASIIDRILTTTWGTERRSEGMKRSRSRVPAREDSPAGSPE